MVAAGRFAYRRVVFEAAHIGERGDLVLRRELDASGGAEIGIDYQILTTNALLKNPEGRRPLITGLDEMPIENVWLRTAGFGATATGAGTRAYIEAVRDLHQIGRPIVADGVGGFSGLAAAAFGAVGGICHGVAQKESFNVGDWKKEPSGGGGGSPKRAYVPDLDRYFMEDQLNHIFAAPGGRSRFGCKDKTCCAHGAEDMIENSEIHFTVQRRRQLDDLSSVPELRRAEHFLLRHVDPAVRSARYGARLKIADEKVARIVGDSKTRLVRFWDAMTALEGNQGSGTRSKSPMFRGGGQSGHGALGLG